MAWKVQLRNGGAITEIDPPEAARESVTNGKSGPLHTIRFGKVQATIWRNETKHGPRFNVTVNRLYLDNEIWKRSDSFGRDELLSAARALQSAYDWIWSQGRGAEDAAQEGTLSD